MLNVFGSLSADLYWAAAVLAEVLGYSVRTVLAIEIEFAPRKRSDYLGDMTRIDVFITYQDGGAHTQCVAVEIKLADRWSSRCLDLSSSRYVKVTNDVGAWKTYVPQYNDRSINQLIRSHLLATLVGYERGAPRPSTLLLMHLGEDELSTRVARTYKECLRDTSLLQVVNLRDLFVAMRATARTKNHLSAVDSLETRYLLENGPAGDILLS